MGLAARAVAAAVYLGACCGSVLAQETEEAETAPVEEQSQAQPGATEAETTPGPAGDAEAPLETIPVPQAEAQPPGEDAAQLEDIVVTATKREKSLREIAGSIGEFNGSRLENDGKFELKD